MNYTVSVEEQLDILEETKKLIEKIETMIPEVRPVKNAQIKEDLDYHISQAWLATYKLIEIMKKEIEDVA